MTTFSEEKKWPKTLPALTAEQKKIKEEFMVRWLEVLPARYAVIEKFNHSGAFKKNNTPPAGRTLEIGAGLGAHVAFENVACNEYYALELRADMAERLRQRFPSAKVVVGDIQKRIDFPDGYFNRIIAVHVLEHLPDLPEALRQIRRLLNPAGFCEFVIPCEGGLAYSIARMISAKRIFEKTYKTSYDWFIKSEHVNTCAEIMEELKKSGFRTDWSRYFPLRLPLIFCNLAIGLRCSINNQ
ncbi:MAG TPA: class I SAM-dependent methyltransferase [Candidatus Omnitrophota bacterium]|nr:class I SAM-dependent methyltransferase [Candidatus Omnitrophota bacterium]